MEEIETKEEYLKTIDLISKLEKSKNSEDEKKLSELYAMVDMYEDTHKSNIHLETLKKRIGKFSEKEVKAYSSMAFEILEYNKQKRQGIKVKAPKFDDHLYRKMREWAKLFNEINIEEKKQEME
jgi:hypothetical protein